MSRTVAEPPAPIEIGVILAGRPDAHRHRLIDAAIERLHRELSTRFERFRFVVSRHRRPDIAERGREESSRLLRTAAELRTRQRWDMALMITPEELIARRRSFAFAALSRPLESALVSTARLVVADHPDQPHRPGNDPSSDPSSDAGQALLVDRLATLLLHAVAHLGGLPEARDHQALLFHPSDAEELDGMNRFSATEIAALDAAFEAIADQRLEEDGTRHVSRWRFGVRAAWINRERIGEAVAAARPWEFPQRLSRLTTAALSTLAVLLMTAESWDLGLSQGWGALGAMAGLVLLATTGFVVTRQQLLMRRHRELREQLVVTRIAALLIVLSGLAITWVGIFALVLLAALTLFDPALVVAWAASNALHAEQVGLATATKMACFCASIALLIGSLGASFEDQQHFQHVIFVDEEL